MTTRTYSSRSQQTTLAYAITSSDTSIQVKSGATLIPDLTVGEFETFTIVIDPDTALEEIVDVSGWSTGNTLTVTRGIDGSPAVSHAAGAVVRHMMIGRDLRESIRTIDTGSVTNDMLAGSIYTTKITGTAITAADTGTVTNTMLAGSIAPSKVTGTAVTAADTGSVTNTMLAGSIAETKHQLVTVGTGSLAGTSTSISLSGVYRRLFIFVQGWSSGSISTLGIRFNTDTGSNYYSSGATAAGTSIVVGQSLAAASVSYATIVVELADQTAIPKMVVCDGTAATGGRYSGAAAISSIQLITSAGSFDAGTYAVYAQ